MVRQPARETLWESAAVAGSRYVRVPGPKACSFCRMLASRGAVYTKSTVLTTGQSRERKGDAREPHTRNPGASGGHRCTSGQRSEGLKYHDHCSCTGQESFSDADLPQTIKALQDEWYDVTYDAQGRMKLNQKKAWDEHIAATRGTSSKASAAASRSTGDHASRRRWFWTTCCSTRVWWAYCYRRTRRR